MRLTRKDDPEGIQRYAHVKPARGLSVRRCSARCSGTGESCTLKDGHRGPHVSHGTLGRVVAVWDEGGHGLDARASTDRLRVTVAFRDGAVERGGSWSRPLVALWRGFVKVMDNIETVGLILMFIAMVWFAVYWLGLLIRTGTGG